MRSIAVYALICALAYALSMYVGVTAFLVFILGPAAPIAAFAIVVIFAPFLVVVPLPTFSILLVLHLLTAYIKVSVQTRRRSMLLVGAAAGSATLLTWAGVSSRYPNPLGMLAALGFAGASAGLSLAFVMGQYGLRGSHSEYAFSRVTS
jgi:hypothetical protein